MFHLCLFLLLIGMSHAVDDKCAACKAVAVITSSFSFLPIQIKLIHLSIIYFLVDLISFDSIRVVGGARDWTCPCKSHVLFQFTCVCNVTIHSFIQSLDLHLNRRSRAIIWICAIAWTPRASVKES